MMGFTQIGDEVSDGSFGLNLGPGDWQVSLVVENTGTGAGFSQNVTVVPEPGAYALIALGGFAFLLRRRRR